MLSITVTTQAGTHHKWKNHDMHESTPYTNPYFWVSFSIFALLIIIRGAIKTFRD